MNAKTREISFMMGLLDEFKAFVADQMAEGMHDEFNDHHDFIKACLELWVDLLDEKPPV